MRILVTGGTGFIGQRLCSALATRGHELWVLSRSPWRAAKSLPGSVRVVESLDQVPDDLLLDAIVNLAGESIAGARWTAKRKQILLDSRVGVTEALYALVQRLKARPRILVSASAVGFYGNAGNAELTESSSAVRRDFSYLLCEAWEQAARKFSGLGMRVCILRIGVVLSHHGGMLKQLLPLYRKGLGVLLGDGSQWFSWIHLEDLVELIIRCLDTQSAEGIYNAVAPGPVTFRRFHTGLASTCRRPALLRVPGRPLAMLLGEVSDIMLGGQRVTPARLEREGFRFRYPDIDSALRAEVL